MTNPTENDHLTAVSHNSIELFSIFQFIILILLGYYSFTVLVHSRHSHPPCFQMQQVAVFSEKASEVCDLERRVGVFLSCFLLVFSSPLVCVSVGAVSRHSSPA